MMMIASPLLLLVAQPAVEVDQVGDESGVYEGEIIDQVGPADRSVDSIPVQPQTEDGSKAVSQLSQRDTDVELGRVEGIDRCSAELLSAMDADFCARRMETRSEEFKTDNEAKLSAEQVLIGERLSAKRRGNDIAGVSREAGRAGISADDRELQALASITLIPPEEPVSPAEGETGAEGDLSTETQALIEAIVQNLANPGG